MGSKREDMTELAAYLWDDCSWSVQNLFSTRIDEELRGTKCGRVVGTGREVLGSGAYVVEMLANDFAEAEGIVLRICEQMKLDDFEISRPD